jgi:hypothetical protein
MKLEARNKSVAMEKEAVLKFGSQDEIGNKLKVRFSKTFHSNKGCDDQK